MNGHAKYAVKSLSIIYLSWQGKIFLKFNEASSDTQFHVAEQQYWWPGFLKCKGIQYNHVYASGLHRSSHSKAQGSRIKGTPGLHQLTALLMKRKQLSGQEGKLRDSPRVPQVPEGKTLSPPSGQK